MKTLASMGAQALASHIAGYREYENGQTCATVNHPRPVSGNCEYELHEVVPTLTYARIAF